MIIQKGKTLNKPSRKRAFLAVLFSSLVTLSAQAELQYRWNIVSSDSEAVCLLPDGQTPGDDFGDMYTSAQSLPSGGSIFGSLGCMDDVDWGKFNDNAKGDYLVTINSESGRSLSAEVRKASVGQSPSTLVKAVTVSGEQPTQLVFNHDGVGEYYVELKDSTAEPGINNYAVYLNSIGIGADEGTCYYNSGSGLVTGDDVGDDQGSAEIIAVDSGFVNNQLGCATDIDFYQFSVSETGSYQVDIYAAGGTSSTTKLEVFDAEGALIDSVVATQHVYVLDAQNTGTYYLSLSESDGYLDYNLRVSSPNWSCSLEGLVPGGNNFCLENSPTGSNDISPLSPYTFYSPNSHNPGLFRDIFAGDRPVYKATLFSGHNYVFRTTAGNQFNGIDAVDMEVYVYDRNGVQINYDDNSGGDVEFLYSVDIVNTDIYYFGVKSKNDTDAGKYIVGLYRDIEAPPSGPLVAGLVDQSAGAYPDFDLDNPVTVAVDSTTPATINTGDRNTFQVSLVAGDNYNIKTVSEFMEYNTELYLYSKTGGASIGYSNNNGDDQMSTISFVAPATDDYLIGVMGGNDSSQVEGYNLQVEKVVELVSACENGVTGQDGLFNGAFHLLRDAPLDSVSLCDDGLLSNDGFNFEMGDLEEFGSSIVSLTLDNLDGNAAGSFDLVFFANYSSFIPVVADNTVTTPNSVVRDYDLASYGGQSGLFFVSYTQESSPAFGSTLSYSMTVGGGGGAVCNGVDGVTAYYEGGTQEFMTADDPIWYQVINTRMCDNGLLENDGFYFNTVDVDGVRQEYYKVNLWNDEGRDYGTFNVVNASNGEVLVPECHGFAEDDSYAVFRITPQLETETFFISFNGDSSDAQPGDGYSIQMDYSSLCAS